MGDERWGPRMIPTQGPGGKESGWGGQVCREGGRQVEAGVAVESARWVCGVGGVGGEN